jgi:hypothetical protein
MPSPVNVGLAETSATHRRGLDFMSETWVWPDVDVTARRPQGDRKDKTSASRR